MFQRANSTSIEITRNTFGLMEVEVKVVDQDQKILAQVVEEIKFEHSPLSSNILSGDRELSIHLQESVTLQIYDQSGVRPFEDYLITWKCIDKLTQGECTDSKQASLQLTQNALTQTFMPNTMANHSQILLTTTIVDKSDSSRRSTSSSTLMFTDLNISSPLVLLSPNNYGMYYNFQDYVQGTIESMDNDAEYSADLVIDDELSGSLLSGCLTISFRLNNQVEFLSNQSVSLKVQINKNSQIATTSLPLRFNSPVNDCQMKISSNTGYEFMTLFKVQVDKCDQDPSALRYMFAYHIFQDYQDLDKFDSLIARGYILRPLQPESTIEIPLVNHHSITSETKQLSTVSITIYNQLGSQSTVFVKIEVLKPVTYNPSQLTTLIKESNYPIQIGSIFAASSNFVKERNSSEQLATYLATLIPTNSNYDVSSYRLQHGLLYADKTIVEKGDSSIFSFTQVDQQIAGLKSEYKQLNSANFLNQASVRKFGQLIYQVYQTLSVVMNNTLTYRNASLKYDHTNRIRGYLKRVDQVSLIGLNCGSALVYEFEAFVITNQIANKQMLIETFQTDVFAHDPLTSTYTFYQTSYQHMYFDTKVGDAENTSQILNSSIPVETRVQIMGLDQSEDEDVASSFLISGPKPSIEIMFDRIQIQVLANSSYSVQVMCMVLGEDGQWSSLFYCKDATVQRRESAFCKCSLGYLIAVALGGPENFLVDNTQPSSVSDAVNDTLTQLTKHEDIITNPGDSFTQITSVEWHKVALTYICFILMAYYLSVCIYGYRKDTFQIKIGQVKSGAESLKQNHDAAEQLQLQSPRQQQVFQNQNPSDNAAITEREALESPDGKQEQDRTNLVVVLEQQFIDGNNHQPSKIAIVAKPMTPTDNTEEKTLFKQFIIEQHPLTTSIFYYDRERSRFMRSCLGLVLFLLSLATALYFGTAINVYSFLIIIVLNTICSSIVKILLDRSLHAKNKWIKVLGIVLSCLFSGFFIFIIAALVAGAKEMSQANSWSIQFSVSFVVDNGVYQVYDVVIIKFFILGLRYRFKMFDECMK